MYNSLIESYIPWARISYSFLLLFIPENYQHIYTISFWHFCSGFGRRIMYERLCSRAEQGIFYVNFNHAFCRWHYCVYIFRVSDNLLKVNKPTLPLAFGEFSMPTAVLLVVAFLVMVMLYVSHRDLRTIYSGIPHGLIFFSHCSFFLRFVRALASE
jgi:hypothetical protein